MIIQVYVLPYMISDHSPIIVKIPDGVQKKKSSFRFSNFITEKKEFIPTVRGVWNKRIEGNKVKECQTEVNRSPHDDSIKKKSRDTLREYQKATKEEYSLLCQKAKVEWLREGDRNIAYFHKTIKERVHRNRIMTIRDEKGNRFGNGDVAVQFVKHFETFLGQKREVQSLACRQSIFKNKISTEDVQRMVRNISDSEIKNAMFEIEDSKAPGPDGYTARFYKSAWSIVGSEVCQAIKEFFSNGKMLGEVNATLITLVPKIPTPDRVSDFRPIACCNVMYKCISKILTTRIKGVLGELVGENQSAFIEGRQITDNILMSQELFRGYNRKQNIKKVAFKIDLQKAYDTISWDFLKEILVMFGFHERMVNWIMICITTAKFSINVNGERVGYFKGGRGLRQGDPISPYLFTLVMEVLNLIIQKNIQDGNGFKYHFGCKNLRITHLCFADDLLVFCHGDIESVRIMKKSLDEFSSVSGLLPNMQKSTIFFGGMSSIEQQSILDIIPFSLGKLPVRYLGVPLLTKKISLNDCKPLINKVKTKVNDWKNKALSYAGRVQLIAAVLNSMQNYWASIFLLPKQVIYEINKILKGFLWCQGELTRGISIAVKKDTLWVKWIYKERLKGKSVWEVNCDSNCTMGWKSILSLRDKIRKHIRWKIGNGKSINVWQDNWCSVSPLSDFIGTRDIYDAILSLNCSVNDIINNGEWKWPEEWINDFAEIDQIQVPILDENVEDRAVWRSNNGIEKSFKISTVWKDISQQEEKVDWHPLVWFNQSIPKHAFVTWLAIQGRLMTQDRLRVWKPNDVLKCSLCGKCCDSHEHLFFKCEFAKGIWKEIKSLLNVRLSDNWNQIISEMERNNRIFKQEKRDADTMVNLIKENTRLKLIGLKVKDSVTVKEVERRWQIQMKKV
ncbi:RNA-directed DNA polymerase, eukaryota, reverse transcriptase zinc-binding domain protein [Tanacetum coccineum]